MKRLHKKIGVGVLVSGLLIGGVSFSSGSVSHASSYESPLLSELHSVLSEFADVFSKMGIPLLPEVKAFLNNGVNGALNYYSDCLFKDILPIVKGKKEEDVVGSIFRLRERGNYSVICVNLEGKQHSIPIKVSSSDGKLNLSLRQFIDAVNRNDNFKGLGLKKGHIYELIIDNNYKFLILIF